MIAAASPDLPNRSVYEHINARRDCCDLQSSGDDGSEDGGGSRAELNKGSQGGKSNCDSDLLHFE